MTRLAVLVALVGSAAMAQDVIPKFQNNVALAQQVRNADGVSTWQVNWGRTPPAARLVQYAHRDGDPQCCPSGQGNTILSRGVP